MNFVVVIFLWLIVLTLALVAWIAVGTLQIRDLEEEAGWMKDYITYVENGWKRNVL